MAKIGKMIATGIVAAAAAAGTYFAIKNKDELAQRAKDLADKIKNNDTDPDIEIEFDDACDFETGCACESACQCEEPACEESAEEPSCE